MTTRTNRTTKLDLRLSPEAKQTLNSALERAAEPLAERQWFELNADQWKEFTDVLDAPPQIVPQIQRLFREPSPFDAPMVE